MQNIKITLLVSTYNRPDALSVCLDSVKYQTLLPDEIVIGDDGSREDTKETIEKIKKNFPIPIIHVWQEDEGFQLAKIRNKSVANSTGDYIIEIDGDVMLSPQFIEDHMRFAQKGLYIKGGRVNLGRKLTEDICQSGISRRIHFWTRGIESKPENAFRSKMLSAYLAPRYRKNSAKALGCNMSFWKEDFIAVNGYDEKFVGWGSEDGDFVTRLHKYGLGKKNLKFAGIVYHLWHEDKHMYNLENNKKYQKEQKEKGVIRCETGIDQYLSK